MIGDEIPAGTALVSWGGGGRTLLCGRGALVLHLLALLPRLAEAQRLRVAVEARLTTQAVAVGSTNNKIIFFKRALAHHSFPPARINTRQ